MHWPLQKADKVEGGKSQSKLPLLIRVGVLVIKNGKERRDDEPFVTFTHVFLNNQHYTNG